MRHQGFLAIIIATACAATGWLLNQVSDLGASEEQSRSFREAYSGQTVSPEPAEEGEGIRLNYFEAEWSRVLRSVAEQAELVLVMDKVPHGKYARRDRKRYTIESAIQMLNVDLESQGFRLLHQGNFLVVLHLDQARTRYARPVIPDSPSGAYTQWKPMNPADQDSQTAASVQGRPSGTPVRQASQQKEASDEPAPAKKSSTGLFGDKVTPSKPQANAAPVDEPMTQKRLDIVHSKAADVARSIYIVFEKRAELVREGLEGLPTFVVRAAEAEATDGNDGKPPTMFQLGINQSENQLILEATQTRISHLMRLIAELDKPKSEEKETVKLIPGKGIGDVTARDLNDQIHRMVAMQTADDKRPVEEPPAKSANGSLNLRGEVNVQAMQELGILILKGNEADIQKVEGIIKQLEEMSVGSLPDIHLLTLNYVNSEAMATLLTSVYEQLSELRQRNNETRKTAAFLPIVQPNALLILSSSIELESILKLADQLDQKVDPNAEFKVFSLKNAISSQVVTALEALYEQRGGLGTRIRVVADVRTNSVIVQGRANDFEEVGKLIEGLDRDQPGSIHRVEIIVLKHATAEELATIINTAIQSLSSPPQQTTTGGGFGQGGQGAQELRAGKSTALEFLTSAGNTQELVRSGILVDVRINADPRTNSLVVSAPESSMSLLKALIRELDRAPSAVAEIKVFALKNADAEQSVTLLTTMFENQNQEEQLGVQIAGTEDASTSLIPLNFSADIRTNTVLAVGSAESLSVVEAILLRLDTTDSRQRKTSVFALRNAPADVVATALDNFLQQQQALQDSSTDLISNIERLRQEVIVVPDVNSNSLIISASPEYFSQVSTIVTELDATPAQIVIQALLVEVQLDNTDEFGVELGFQDPLLFNRSIVNTAADIVSTTTTTQTNSGTIQSTNVQSINRTPGFNFNNTAFPLGNNGLSTQNPGRVGSQSLSNFSLGRQNTDLGFGGFVFAAQSDAVNVLIRALAARRTVHVLSRPQIRTTHNNEASIQVGQQVPIVDGVTVTNNFVTPTITQQNVGIILTVTPRVTPDGIVNMDVYAEKSSVSAGGVPVFTDAASGNVVESVIIDSAIADTTVGVPNGQTIVIGGMITKSDETLERKVPWLGDLPLVGSLFRYDGTTTARTELLIFLTPRIVYNDIDSELIKQVESERLHFIESEAEEIHGPLYSVPQRNDGEYMVLPPGEEGEFNGPPVLPPVDVDRVMTPEVQAPVIPNGPAPVPPHSKLSGKQSSSMVQSTFGINRQPNDQPAGGSKIVPASAQASSSSDQTRSVENADLEVPPSSGNAAAGSQPRATASASRTGEDSAGVAAEKQPASKTAKSSWTHNFGRRKQE